MFNSCRWRAVAAKYLTAIAGVVRCEAGVWFAIPQTRSTPARRICLQMGLTGVMPFVCMWPAVSSCKLSAVKSASA